ncbi:hypothetical protein D9619_000032 [Psilocybe cf. subviscida]|uniref:Uncharacterized protein n=1 Tax=Psilocybe cf. subviscida TaxID=2480587 RepID=A0A8H5BCN7_9AGAR|nr:hypothetical protein D9619_000032 [Psilocybe cf. subviscida]
MSALVNPHNAHLPRELYGEITAYFDHRTDKRTLCDLALVSPVLRAESQRVLFRRMTDNWPLHLDKQREACELKHKAFLLAIVTNPERLGPYVQAYAQVRHFYCYGDEDERLQAHPPLWTLTIEALPAMINLKHLYMEPTAPMSAAVPTSISSWKFQLESLTWIGLDDLTYLLRSQRSLQHLELGRVNKDEDGLQDLPDDICPTLTSASGSICTLKRLGRNRRMEAFYATEMCRADYKSFCRGNWSTLMNLKYLSLQSCRSFDRMKNSFRLDVKLLELRWWNWEVCMVYRHFTSTKLTSCTHSFKKLRTIQASAFPQLQVLVLVVTRTITKSQEQIHKAVADISQRLPTLNYVLLNHNDGNYIRSYRYSQMETPAQESISGENAQVGGQITLMVFRMDKEVGSVWWKMYTPFPAFVAIE